MGDHFKSPAPASKIWNPINPYEPNICNKIPESISAASSPLAMLAEQVRRKRSEASRISPTPENPGVLRIKSESRTFPSHPSIAAALEGDECALDLSTKNSRQPEPLKKSSFDPLKNCSELHPNSSESSPFLMGAVSEGNGIIGPVFSLAKLHSDPGIDQYDQSFKDSDHPMKLFTDLKEIHRISPKPDDSSQADIQKLQNPPRSEDMPINPFKEKIQVSSKFDDISTKSHSKRKMFSNSSRPDDSHRKPFIEIEDMLQISPRFDNIPLKSSDAKMFPKSSILDHKPPKSFTDIEGNLQISPRMEDIPSKPYTETKMFSNSSSRVDSNNLVKSFTESEKQLLVAPQYEDNHKKSLTETKIFLNSSRSEMNTFKPFPEMEDKHNLSPKSHDMPTKSHLKKTYFSRTDDGLTKPFSGSEEDLDVSSQSDEIPVKSHMKTKVFSRSDNSFKNPFTEIEEKRDVSPKPHDLPTKPHAKRKLYSSPCRTDESVTKPFSELEENLEVSPKSVDIPTKKPQIDKKISSKTDASFMKSFSELEEEKREASPKPDEIPAKSRTKRKLFSTSSRSVDSSLKASFSEIEENIQGSSKSDVTSAKSLMKRKVFSRSSLKKTFAEIEVSPKSDEIPTECHTDQKIFPSHSTSDDDSATKTFIELEENPQVSPKTVDSLTKTDLIIETSLASKSDESVSKTLAETEGIFPSSPKYEKTPKKRSVEPKQRRQLSGKSEMKKKSPMSPPVSSLRSSPMYKKRKLIPKSPFATARRLKLNPDLSQSTPTPSSLPSRSPSPEPATPAATKTSTPINNKHTGRTVRRMPSGEPIKWIKRLIGQPAHSNKKKSYMLLKKCTPCCVVMSKLPLENGQRSVDLSSCSEQFTDVFNNCTKICWKEYGKIHNPWIKALHQRMKRLFAVLLWGQTPKFISIRMESLVKCPKPPKSQPRRGPSLESATPGKRRFFLLELKRKTILIPVVGNKMGERAFELDNPKNIGILYNIAASLQKSSEDE